MCKWLKKIPAKKTWIKVSTNISTCKQTENGKKHLLQTATFKYFNLTADFHASQAR